MTASPFLPPLYSVTACQVCGEAAGDGKFDPSGDPLCVDCAQDVEDAMRQQKAVARFVQRTLRPLMKREFASFVAKQPLPVSAMHWLLAEELELREKELQHDFAQVTASAPSYLLSTLVTPAEIYFLTHEIGEFRSSYRRNSYRLTFRTQQDRDRAAQLIAFWRNVPPSLDEVYGPSPTPYELSRPVTVSETHALQRVIGFLHIAPTQDGFMQRTAYRTAEEWEAAERLIDTIRVYHRARKAGRR